jgi:hypothetical protein
MTDRISSTAKVQLTIEIDSLASWGGNCAVDQVFRQSKEEAINRTRAAFKAVNHGVRLIGEPVVTGVTYKSN